MTRSNETNPTTTRPDFPPSVAELLGRYLQRQMDAHEQGLGYPETTAHAQPYEAVPVQPVDPQLAWKDALAVTASMVRDQAGLTYTVPPDWPTLVGQQEPAIALAFSLGNFPQLVRNLHPLLTGEIALRQATGEAIEAPSLVRWANGQRQAPTPQRLLAAGVLRLARHFERADELLSLPVEPGPWRDVHANEVAALVWHRGQGDKALELWRQQPASAPVLFNRGMAALFLGDKVSAATDLRQAAAMLPETSAWHHLASLYLTMSTMGG